MTNHDNLKCSYCGGEYTVEVKIKPAMPEIERYVFENIMRFTAGLQPHKGHIKLEGEYYSYEFYLQIYDSPEGDTWISGKAKWLPGFQFEILEMEYS